MRRCLLIRWKPWQCLWPVFLLRKFYTERMFALLRTKRMQFRSHADTQPVKRSKGVAIYIYIYRIKFRMLEVRENELALRKLSGGTVQLEGNTASCLLEKKYPALKICCVNYRNIPGNCCQRSVFLCLLPSHGVFSSWRRKGKAFCERPFALYHQQLEIGKQNFDVGPLWKNFCGRPCCV